MFLSSRIKNIVRITFEYVHVDFRVFNFQGSGELEKWTYVKIIFVPGRAVIRCIIVLVNQNF